MSRPKVTTRRHLQPLLYRIYYGAEIVYVGRTNQPLQDRIRGHLFAKPMHRKIEIEKVTKIEYAEFASEADRNLYEIYFILLYKPLLNVDDKCRDVLTIEMPPIEWKPFVTNLWNRWLKQITENVSEYERAIHRHRQLPQERRVLHGNYKMGRITEKQLEDALFALEQESEALRAIIYDTHPKETLFYGQENA